MAWLPYGIRERRTTGIWRDFQCVLCYPQAQSLNDWSLHDHVASVKHRKGVMLMKGVPDARWEHLWEDDAPPTDFPGHAVPGACMAQERRPPSMFVGSCLATGLGMPQRPPCRGGIAGNFPPPPPNSCGGAASAGSCAASSAMFLGDNTGYQQPMFGQPPVGPWMHMHANHFQHPDATWFTSGASSSGACAPLTMWVPPSGSAASASVMQTGLPALSADMLKQLDEEWPELRVWWHKQLDVPGEWNESRAFLKKLLSRTHEDKHQGSDLIWSSRMRSLYFLVQELLSLLHRPS